MEGGMTRISKVYPKDFHYSIKVRRQRICENGSWIDAVFERKTWINGEFVSETLVRIR